MDYTICCKINWKICAFFLCSPVTGDLELISVQHVGADMVLIKLGSLQPVNEHTSELAAELLLAAQQTDFL